MGLVAYDLRIRRLGLNGADFGPLRLGSPLRPALRIDHVQVDYSVVGLMRQHIDRVTVSGLSIHGTIHQGRLQLRGFELAPILERINQKAAQGSGTPHSSDPYTIGEVIINNAVAEFEHNHRSTRLPFEIIVGFHNDNNAIMQFSGRIFPSTSSNFHQRPVDDEQRPP